MTTHASGLVKAYITPIIEGAPPLPESRQIYEKQYEAFQKAYLGLIENTKRIQSPDAKACLHLLGLSADRDLLEWKYGGFTAEKGWQEFTNKETIFVEEYVDQSSATGKSANVERELSTLAIPLEMQAPIWLLIYPKIMRSWHGNQPQLKKNQEVYKKFKQLLATAQLIIQTLNPSYLDLLRQRLPLAWKAGDVCLLSNAVKASKAATKAPSVKQTNTAADLLNSQAVSSASQLNKRPAASNATQSTSATSQSANTAPTPPKKSGWAKMGGLLAGFKEP